MALALVLAVNVCGWLIEPYLSFWDFRGEGLTLEPKLLDSIRDVIFFDNNFLGCAAEVVSS